ASQSKRDGSINGRILRDDGRPAAGVEISIRRISEPRGSERTTTSDEEGLFRFTNLAPAVYAIEAEVPGYIVDGASLRSNVYRTGEQATIRLTKGGVITLRGLSAGRYFLAANLPDDNWYVRAISLPAPVSASSQRTAATAKKPAESGSSGITVKSGEKLSGVELNVSEGAAALRGKIIPAAETDKAPSRIRIHLIPAEVSAANDVLRYTEMISGPDRKFEFKNIAPGKYWVLTRPAVENDQERPVAWDPIERVKLRREAAAGKNEIELQSCQRVKNLEVRFIP